MRFSQLLVCKCRCWYRYCKKQNICTYTNAYTPHKCPDSKFRNDNLNVLFGLGKKGTCMHIYRCMYSSCHELNQTSSQSRLSCVCVCGCKSTTHVNLLLSLDNDGLSVSPQCGDAHRCARHGKVGQIHDLLALPGNLHVCMQEKVNPSQEICMYDTSNSCICRLSTHASMSSLTLRFLCKTRMLGSKYT